MSKSPLNRTEKFAVAVLSLVTFLLRVPLAFRPERELAGLPYTDDCFYLFSIARSIAKGLGPTVDGTHLTNGFQPLIVLLYTPIFWLCGSRMTDHADSWLAIRWSFILNAAIAALMIWAVAQLLKTLERAPETRGFTAPIAGAAIWTFTIAIFAEVTNGLETGLSSLLLFIALILYAKLQTEDGMKSPISRWVVLGLVLGLAVLARIDAAIFVAILTITLVIKRQSIEAVITAGMALLVSAPWWVFNLVSFGNLMPSSGQAENSWPMPPFENIRRAVQAISDILSLVFYLPGHLGPIVRSVWIVLFICGILFICYRLRLFEKLSNSFRLKPLFPFLLFSIALLLFYTFFFRAPHFISRYLQPGRILWSIIVAISVSILWREKIARSVIIGVAVIGLTFSIVEYSGNYFPAHQADDLFETGVWANHHPDEKIAMLQSGIASFVAPNVINLDGKVNSDALRAHQQGKLSEYLRDEHFTYIADWKPFIEDIAATLKKDELYFDSVGMINKILLMKRRIAATPLNQTPATPSK
jgi:hypothetical protein